MSPIIVAIVVLGGIGIVCAAVLFFVARKFNVEEDPRIESVEALLPGANCGACGYNGCHDFAVNCVKSASLEGKMCPAGGQKAMDAIGEILGLKADATVQKIAVLRCNGTYVVRKSLSRYDGPRSCAIEKMVYAGETACQYGCLGCGDCVEACRFGAVRIDGESGLPVFDEQKCTACGVCVSACPGKLIELRNKGPKNRRVYVACANCEKGAVAMKNCKAACIGCGKCVKACPFEAITVANNLAYIDYAKCRLCRKCVDACPQHCIIAVNFPVPKQKEEVTC